MCHIVFMQIFSSELVDALSLNRDLVIGGSGMNDSESYIDFVNDD